MVQHVVAMPRAEGVRERTRPRPQPAVVGLVRENAGDGLAEVAAAFREVGLVRDLDELVDRLRAERVEVGAVVVPAVGCVGAVVEAQQRLALGARGVGAGEAAVGGDLVLVRLAGDGEPGERDGRAAGFDVGAVRAVLHDEPAQAVLGEDLGDLAAGGAAGPAVLVVEPGVHAQLLRLVGAGLDAGEPVATEIFGVEAHARMHEEAAEAHLLHDADLAAQLGGREFGVPGPEGRAAKCLAGILQRGGEGLVHEVRISVRVEV